MCNICNRGRRDRYHMACSQITQRTRIAARTEVSQAQVGTCRMARSLKAWPQGAKRGKRHLLAQRAGDRAHEPEPSKVHIP